MVGTTKVELEMELLGLVSNWATMRVKLVGQTKAEVETMRGKVTGQTKAEVEME